MNGPPIRIVTVSRELGSGGSEFAAGLGARLGWPVLDHGVVHRIAERLRMDDSTVEHLDEHPPSLLARIASFLVIPQPELYEFPPPGGVPDHDRIAHAATRVIRQAGEHPPLVVVGHGSQCIFAGRPDALHVFMHGPLEARTRRVIERLGVKPAAAAAVVQRADLERAAYVQRYFHTDWRTPALYDLQFFTAKIPVADAVAVVERLVRERMAAPVAEGRGTGPGTAHAG